MTRSATELLRRALAAWLGRGEGAGEGGRRPLERALDLAGEEGEIELLIAVLAHPDALVLRANALAAVLELADESHPRFAELIGHLLAGERALVLGTLLEATRLDADPERRLVRLRRLMKVLPQDSRTLYWPEAEALARQGGDDAQLALLDFVRDLPRPSRPLAMDTLRRAVRGVAHPFKRTMAFLALAELTDLDEGDRFEAGVSAERIPDDTLRIMALTRIAQIEGREPG